MTRPRDQPMARSVPISRTRLAMLDSVSSAAMRNAASKHDDRQRPAEMGGQGVGVGEAPRHLAGQLLVGEDLGAGDLLVDGGGHRVHVGGLRPP